jgi:hypothetical protein
MSESKDAERITAALRGVLTPMHDVATVYFAAPPPAEIRPVAEAHRRWRALANQLRAQGADEPTLRSIGSPVRAAAALRCGVAVFAHSGRVVYTQTLPGWSGGDVATFGAPAPVAPLLEWVQAQVPYVVVVTDRTGADITGFEDTRHPLATVRVDGPDDEIERNAPGGWSQPRYQRRAEDSWEHNAAAVAAQTARIAHAVDAHLVIVTGDVRAVQLLDKELAGAKHHDLVVEHLTGGRHPDGSEEEREARAARKVRGFLADRAAALLATLADLRGPAGLAVDGVTATLTALTEGRVATLIVDAGAPTHPAVWFAAPPAAIAVNPAEVFERHHSVRSGPPVDVAIRAALLTGATVRVLPAGTGAELHDGIGALCRFQRPAPGAT